MDRSSAKLIRIAEGHQGTLTARDDADTTFRFEFPAQERTFGFHDSMHCREWIKILESTRDHVVVEIIK